MCIKKKKIKNYSSISHVASCVILYLIKNVCEFISTIQCGDSVWLDPITYSLRQRVSYFTPQMSQVQYFNIIRT